MKTKIASRRDALRTLGTFGSAALAAGGILSLTAQAADRTPPQTEGPFYPVKDQLDKDADMTRVVGRSNAALGQRVVLTGQVLDAATEQPIAGAMVEFWQACATGKYDHPGDSNSAELDKNFQYWSQVRTNMAGMYAIRTVKPGAYPATPTWIRPPHIHVKVHKAGYPSLTTQLYFEGDKHNATDQILGRLSVKDQGLVTVKFELSTENDVDTNEPFLRGHWKIYIQKFNPKSRSEKVTPDLEH